MYRDRARRPRPRGAKLALAALGTAQRALAELVDALYPLRCHVCGARALEVGPEDGEGDTRGGGDPRGPRRAPADGGAAPTRCAAERCVRSRSGEAEARAFAACAQHALPCGPPGERCGVCAAPLPEGIPGGERCAACRCARRGFAATVALADYAAQPAVRDWVLRLKYGGRRDLARPLAAALAGHVAERGCAPGTLCVGVPLHRWRRLERGYDQAALLAEALARELGLDARRILERVRATGPQGAPGSVSRAANVRRAFRPRARLDGEPVLLVDDVVTSCATVAECAATLRRAGAGPIVVACVARASAAASGAAQGAPVRGGSRVEWAFPRTSRDERG